ncbi:MFS transporter [Mycobacterium fragae]|uniref:MFS transporter n=1 Tax=Mycobacterium fragae TaxID=1260918 RepID=A0A1X1V6K6_9MYCO|nr:MFS transporter [Mycobacterium fragae]ORV64659.1 MFS transporter [Mycobacterium fragae]
MTTATGRKRSGGPARRAGAPPTRKPTNRTDSGNPWHALWAMMVGFFMILLDSTIVAVANPSIMIKLGTGYDTVIWVTSAYLLAYAVPLLVAGRLGDRFGPKNLYLAGLAVFTAASLWCGLSGSVGMLIAARVVQGIGAAVLTPQTLSTITRIFPPQRRGVAMSVWGATAGVATLVGPLVGGVLVDGLGWEWIFFVNVPIGIIGLGLAVWLIPVLPTHKHRFDAVGVGLSGAGMFLIVFALQEGQSEGWQPWIWAVIVAGIGFMAGFVYWQSINTHEPLIPLEIFRDRDFSLSNLGVAVIGFVATAMVLPLMFYAQAVCGLSPTRSALLMAPMAITSGLLAPIVGNIVDRSHPRPVVGFGFSVLAIGLTWLSIAMTPSTAIWLLVLPFIVMGVGMAFIWSPLGATATRNLPPRLAGAGSGVYNATRQVGAVLGSAGIAAFMTSRISAELPPMPGGLHPDAAEEDGALQLPSFLREPFAAAMSQSTLLPAFIALFGVAAALFMVGFTTSARAGQAASDAAAAQARQRVRLRPNASDAADNAGDFDDGYDDGYDDDGDYVEFTLVRPADAAPLRPSDVAPSPVEAGEEDTEPLSAHAVYPRPAPSEAWHSSPVEAWHSLLDEPAPAADEEPIGFAHNGFHVDEERRFRPIADFSPPTASIDDIDETYGAPGRPSEHRNGYQRPSRHARHDEPRAHPPRNRHYRADPDDTVDYGRHSFRD